MAEKNQEPVCFGFRESTCIGVWQAIAVVFIILTLIVVIINVALVVERDSLHRVCGFAKATDITNGIMAEPDAVFLYKIKFSGDSNSIDYRIRWNASAVSPVIAVHLRGPVESNSFVGPLAGTLCGAPMATACAIDTNGGETSGIVRHTLHNGVAPHGIDVRTFIEPFRRDPELYYLEILTMTAPTSPGAARSQLISQCGYP